MPVFFCVFFARTSSWTMSCQPFDRGGMSIWSHVRTHELPDIMNLSKSWLCCKFNSCFPSPLRKTLAAFPPPRVKTADGSGSSAVASAVGSAVVVCDNFIGGESIPPLSGEYLDVVSPSDGTMLGRWGSRIPALKNVVTILLQACSTKKCNSPPPKCFSTVAGRTRSTPTRC